MGCRRGPNSDLKLIPEKLRSSMSTSHQTDFQFWSVDLLGKANLVLVLHLTQCGRRQCLDRGAQLMALAVCGRSRDSISDGSKRKVEGGGVGYNV